MNTMRLCALAATLAVAATSAQAAGKELNVYNWSDYIAEGTVPAFSKATGIKVRYDVYDSMEVLRAKLMTGRSGYDVVVPTNNTLDLGIKAGFFQPVDKSKLPNYKSLDPELLKLMSQFDAGNKFGVPYFWGVITLAINEDKVKKALGGPLPANQWDLFFKPEYVSKLKGCGVSVLDSPSEFFPVALKYYGKNPNSDAEADYQGVMPALKTVRPYITRFSSSGYINEMAGGDVCLALGYGGDLNIAKRRAEEAKNGVKINVLMPKGVAIWVDSMAIPKDAANVESAHAFINAMLDAKTAAANANAVTYAPGVLSARPFVDKKYLANRSIFPTADDVKNGFIMQTVSPKTIRTYTRLWQSFRTGR
ncbi:polyamine ABC transporter substrate-binding protein [Gulbenkiania indica]|nr:polyamine ABC transporter substrate-binding protein [Gulbenkiania indica]